MCMGGRGSVFVVVMIPVNLDRFRVSGCFRGDLMTADGGGSVCGLYPATYDNEKKIFCRE